jgi:ferric-dicitrate binding protein FerR (iron transport regulator)
VRECLRCQAEVAAFRRVLRIMHDMQGEVDPPAARHPWPTRPTPAASRHLRVAYIGGITVGAAGVFAWLSRHCQIAG